MKGPAQLATYIAALMVGGGFLIIILAWNGAAERNSLPQQFPYLLSGGIGGLGFIMAGMIVFFVQAARMQTAQRARLMRELNMAMARLVAVSRAAQAGDRGAPDAVIASPPRTLNGQVDEPAPSGNGEGGVFDTAVLAATAPLEPLTPSRPRSLPESAPPRSPRRPASGSSRAPAGGGSAAAPAAAPAARKRTPPSQKIMIVGRSSFHDPSCRLVVDRDDLPSVVRKEAVAEGRSPCRICNP